MVTKIDKLTENQKAAIPAWTDKWVEIGSSTERVDFKRAEKAVLACYAAINSPPPKKILHVESPWAAIYEGSKEVLKIRDGKVEKAELHKFIKDNWKNYQMAQLSAPDMSYVTYFRDICNWENPSLENFKLQEELALSCGFVWWDDDVVAISDRPKKVCKDKQGRLHNSKGKALEYRDGWGVYSWHGHRISGDDSWWITSPEKLTMELIEAQPVKQKQVIMGLIYIAHNYGTLRNKSKKRSKN